jgi:hypothetical protein
LLLVMGVAPGTGLVQPRGCPFGIAER